MEYSSNLTDSEWKKIANFFDCGNYGNRSEHAKKDLVNAVLYITKTGCQWRLLPHDLPPWQTVYSFFRRAKKKGIWDNILKVIVAETRENSGKNPSPSYSITDSQTVKTTGPAMQRGIDGGKKNKGSKASY